MLILTLIALTGQLTLSLAAVDINSFLPFGPGAGDTQVRTGLHLVEGPIPLRVKFPFFEKKESELFIGTNGVLTFAQGFPQFAPTTCGPLAAEWRMVAPFWADFDTNQGGAIYYRESNDAGQLETISREVSAAFPQLWGLSLNWLFIATWFEGPYHNAPQPSCPGYPLNNTLQAILATDGTFSFAVFYYHRISWTTGAWGSSDICGLGGIPARVGFDPGDNKNFYSIPASCSNSILHLASMSNLPTPSPGKFVFRIDNAKSIDPCTNSNDSSIVLLISSPSFINFMGNRPIILSGPCFNRTDNVSCIFHDPKGDSSTVPASVVIFDGYNRAICRAPYFKRTGPTRVQLVINGFDATNVSNSTTTAYTGSLTVTNEEPELQVGYERETTRVNLAFRWSPTLFSENALNLTVRTVSIRMITYDANRANWIDSLVVASNVSNSLGEVNATLVFANVSWLVSPEFVSRSFSAFRVDVSDSSSFIGLTSSFVFKTAFSKFFCGSLFFPKSIAERDKRCTAWYYRQSALNVNQTVCPPLLKQALEDWRFEREPLNEIGGIYRPNAVYSFRSRVPQEGTGYCQQCTYNAAGQLLVGPVDGGNLRRVHPLVDPIGHWIEDVIPFCDCCLELKTDRCSLYYQKRPSNNGNDYRPPSFITGSGDPHFMTLDGVQYTFNPIGEFWLIRQQLPGGSRFEVQTRIEKYVAPTGSSERPLNASIFTAFVMRRTDSTSFVSTGEVQKTVQVQRSQSTGLEVLIDGVLFPIESALGRSQRVDNFAIDVTSIDGALRVRVVFDAGWALEFSSSQGALTYTVAASEQNRDTPRGLSGNFNGNPDDDLVTPDGVRIPKNATMREIHYNFGMTWNVSAAESLFTYPSGRNHSSFQEPSFVPSFHMPTAEELPPDVRAMCGASRTCLFDFESTGGNLALANNTVKQEERIKNIVETLNTTVLLCTPHVLSQFAVVSTTNGYFNGSVATLLCTIDSVLYGNNVTRCMNGFWSNPLGDCVSLNSTTVPSPTIPSTPEGIGLFKPPLLFAFIGGIVFIILLILGLIIAIICICRCRKGNSGTHTRSNENSNGLVLGSTTKTSAL